MALFRGWGRFWFSVVLCIALCTFQSVTKEADGTLTLTLENGEKMEGFDQVLVATGREPILDKLGLENAGVATDGGYITVRFIQSMRSPVDAKRAMYMLLWVSIHWGWKAAWLSYLSCHNLHLRENSTCIFDDPRRVNQAPTLARFHKIFREAFKYGRSNACHTLTVQFFVVGAGGRLPEHERRRDVRGGRRVRQEGEFDFDAFCDNLFL